MILTDQEPAKRISTDPRRDLLDRILASSWFVKSGRLSSLLIYICDLTLEGRGEQISEQSIGQAVFGRQQNYDSANDGIVRTQISRLRQKLDAYFEADGGGETIRIVIPRGGYVPFFVPHLPVKKPEAMVNVMPLASLPLEMPSSPSASNVPSVPAQPHRRGSGQFAWGLAALLALALLTVLVRDARRRITGAAAHPLWSQIFQPGNPTLIVPADSPMVFWQSVAKQNVDLADYLKGSFRDTAIEEARGTEKTGLQFAQGRYTSIVDLETASWLSQLAVRLNSAAQIRYARDVRPNDFKEGNAVLIGTTEANPWVSLFEKDMNFVFHMDRERHVFSVWNKVPQSGEPAAWDSSSGSDREHRVYCVVAYRPNLSGNGKVLILEGTSMAGTECAWDFASDDSRLLPFLQKIGSRYGSIPYFEVVLGTNNMSGSAVRSTILAWRVQETGNHTN
ncbi:hypothetical protein [Silvibacterium dinghuense]|uniref:Uncharacterized protein n=1 Tax=Silvibacterium dinghuense TaxID=1560006 RepID=A0A4Q1SGB0_9BACT|nr:hypothetical protein [Silvibacterium dinghuense]RXS96568.1 hypothetical protein ESZ00_01030 [Silvibacterium dinghuense]GGG91852.1 hypothetical protein GCM10011586_03120 [Silvibacterium dinghuense]